MPTNESTGFATDLLATSGHRARVRMLDAHPDRIEPGLLAELQDAAREVLRDDPREAGRRAQLAFVVADRLRIDSARVECLLLRAKAAITGGAYELAADSLDDASARAGACDAALVGEVDLARVTVLSQLERHAEARSVADALLVSCERRGDVRGSVLTHMALGDLEYRVDRPRRALAHYREVERLLPASARRMHAALASNRANSLQARNRFRAARRHFERSLELFSAGGCEHTAAQVEYNLAYAELTRGRYTEALRRFARVEEVFRRLDDKRHVAHVSLDKAEAHVHLNLPADALELATAAESAFEELALEKERAQAARLHGRAAELLGQGEVAAASYARAEEAFARLGLDERTFACRIQRACLAEQEGRRKWAEQLAAEAEPLLREDANPLSRASLALLRARLAFAAGRFEEALSTARAVRRDCRRIHAPWAHIEAQRTIGRALAEMGRLEESIAAFRDAVERLERYRGGVPPDEYMTAFLAGRSALYHEAVDVLVRRGEYAEAFDLAESAKCRSLDDLLLARHDAPLPPGVAGPSARRLRHLREQLNAVYQRLFRREGEADARSRRFIASAHARAGELEDEIGRLLRRDGLASQRVPTLPGRRDMEVLRAALGERDAYLSYLVTDERLFVFVLTRRAAHVVRTPTSRAELEQLLGRFRYHLKRATRVRPGLEDLVLQATRANLGALAELLIAPVAEHLDARRVVVVPGAPLHELPFHALPLGGGWLGDEREIVYAPSATIYARCVRSADEVATGEPRVFGLPDELAPRIGREALRVGEAVGGRVFLGEEATFDRLAEAAREARIVHVATHGMFRSDNPELSAVRLADRWMNLYDTYALRFRGELVVLATCESGTATMSGGDEVIGLTRGLLYAGAPALVTSQWTVDDAAAALFMDRFYTELARTDDVMTAYRLAIAAVRTSHPHPYYWAPFFLTGRPVDRTTAAARFGSRDPVPSRLAPCCSANTTET